MRCFKLIICFCVLFLPLGLAASVQADARYSVVSSQQVTNRILDLNGQRRALFVYASWCPYCRKALPEILKAHKMSDGAVVPVSVDKDPGALTAYMGAFQAPDFPLLVWDHKGNLANEMARFDINGWRYSIHCFAG